MNSDNEQLDSSSVRIDRITEDVKSDSSVLEKLGKLLVIPVVYLLAAFLFHLPPFGPIPPTPVCQNLSASSSSSGGVQHEIAVVLAPNNTFLNFGQLLDTETTGELKDIVQNDTKLSVILADGNPRPVAEVFVHWSGGENPDFKKRDAFSKLTLAYECVVGHTMKSGVVDKIASTAGQDALDALQKAGASFTGDVADRKVFVISNGLQTAGTYRFQDGFPSGVNDAKKIASQLQRDNSLADLKGATVTWVGLGETDGTNQLQLNPRSEVALTQFWTTIVEAANGVVGQISEGTIPITSPDQNSPKSPSVAGLADPCIFIQNGDDDLRFKSNTAEFLDPAKAKSVAKTNSEQIHKRGCTSTVTVTGYVASGVSKKQYEKNSSAGCSLSLHRAEAFKRLLVQAGVTVPLISVGGCKGPYYDWDSQGQPAEQDQARNRFVTVSQ